MGAGETPRPFCQKFTSKLVKVIKIESQIPDLVDRFTSIMAHVGKFVVNRDSELNALKICLLTRHHLLLEGDPGLAKSRFALLAFKAFSDASVYQNMFHGQSTTDEVFGPPNTKSLREKGILEFNTEGMLPRAHLAYLDELFHGPGAVLNSTLNILNERTFTSGGKALRCPLVTAVATTNKVSEEVEFAALIDRFLIMRRVKAADSHAARLRIIRAFNEAEDVDDIKFHDSMTMKELVMLQTAVKRVKVPDSFISMLESVRTQYVSNGGGVLISDRRFCWAYRAIQASILLSSEGRFVEDPKLDSMLVLSDVFPRKPADFGVVESIIVSQFQMFQRAVSEDQELRELETSLKNRINKYDSSWEPPRKRKEYRTMQKTLEQFRALSPEQQYTITSNADRFRTLITEIEEFQNQLEIDLGIKDADGNLLNVADPDDGAPNV